MLYIMRHGKTEWNEKHKLQGRTNIPLNEDGREMAKRAAAEYADINFDICYCSPLIRALETAQIVLENRNVPIVTDDRLMEMCFGIYEGVENCLEIPNCPISLFFNEPDKYIIPAPEGESFEELFSRTGEFLKEIVEPLLAEDKDILIVGHGAMNSSIVCQIRELPLNQFWSAGIENCKLMKLK